MHLLCARGFLNEYMLQLKVREKVHGLVTRRTFERRLDDLALEQDHDFGHKDDFWVPPLSRTELNFPHLLALELFRAQDGKSIRLEMARDLGQRRRVGKVNRNGSSRFIR